jgi:hypothetical protein
MWDSRRNGVDCSSPSCLQLSPGTHWLPPVWSYKGWTTWMPFCKDELKQSFYICSKVEAGHFMMLVYSVLLSVGKSVLKITLWKSRFIITKDVWIVHVNFIVIAITFFEKKFEAFLSYCHLYYNLWELVEGSTSAHFIPSQVLYFPETKLIRIHTIL